MAPEVNTRRLRGLFCALYWAVFALLPVLLTDAVGLTTLVYSGLILVYYGLVALFFLLYRAAVGLLLDLSTDIPTRVLTGLVAAVPLLLLLWTGALTYLDREVPFDKETAEAIYYQNEAAFDRLDGLWDRLDPNTYGLRADAGGEIILHSYRPVPGSADRREWTLEEQRDLTEAEKETLRRDLEGMVPARMRLWAYQGNIVLSANGQNRAYYTKREDGAWSLTYYAYSGRGRSYHAASLPPENTSILHAEEESPEYRRYG